MGLHIQVDKQLGAYGSVSMALFCSNVTPTYSERHCDGAFRKGRSYNEMVVRSVASEILALLKPRSLLSIQKANLGHISTGRIVCAITNLMPSFIIQGPAMRSQMKLQVEIERTTFTYDYYHHHCHAIDYKPVFEVTLILICILSWCVKFRCCFDPANSSAGADYIEFWSRCYDCMRPIADLNPCPRRNILIFWSIWLILVFVSTMPYWTITADDWRHAHQTRRSRSSRSRETNTTCKKP